MFRLIKIDSFFNITNVNEVKFDLPVITYLSTYCCYITLKKFKCESHKTNLLFRKDLVAENNFLLIKHLSRGNLLYSKENVIDLVIMQYILFKKIKKYEE